MPKGIYKHKNGQGFLNPRHTYTVMIGAKVYHRGHIKRDATWAFKRARRPAKGQESLAAGKWLTFRRDGICMVKSKVKK